MSITRNDTWGFCSQITDLGKILGASSINHKSKPMRLLFFLMALGLGICAPAQSCMSFEDYTNSGQRIELLDSLYPSAMNVDPEKAVFNGREKEFSQAWVGLLQDLANHLKQNGFEWEEPSRCFNRVYFSETGKIDAYLFRFMQEALTEVEEKRFTVLLNEFVADYQLKLVEAAPSKFAQCGPVVYQNPQ